MKKSLFWILAAASLWIFTSCETAVMKDREAAGMVQSSAQLQGMRDMDSIHGVRDSEDKKTRISNTVQRDGRMTLKYEIMDGDQKHEFVYEYDNNKLWFSADGGQVLPVTNPLLVAHMGSVAALAIDLPLILEKSSLQRLPDGPNGERRIAVNTANFFGSLFSAVFSFNSEGDIVRIEKIRGEKQPVVWEEYSQFQDLGGFRVAEVVVIGEGENIQKLILKKLEVKSPEKTFSFISEDYQDSVDSVEMEQNLDSGSAVSEEMEAENESENSDVLDKE